MTALPVEAVIFFFHYMGRGLQLVKVSPRTYTSPVATLPSHCIRNFLLDGVGKWDENLTQNRAIGQFSIPAI